MPASPMHVASAFLLALALTSGSLAQAPPAAPVTRESLAGAYDGGQMEVAAQLLLKPDGRFQYELAYGALDETAEGTWAFHDGAVFLTTVPAAIPPRFVIVSDTPDPRGGLSVKLTKPLVEGMRQRVLLLYVPTRSPSRTPTRPTSTTTAPSPSPPANIPSPSFPRFPFTPLCPHQSRSAPVAIASCCASSRTISAKPTSTLRPSPSRTASSSCPAATCKSSCASNASHN